MVLGAPCQAYLRVHRAGRARALHRKAVWVEDRATRERLGEDKQEDVGALKSTARLVP